MLSFITPTQGNPLALLRTMESLKGVCDEFVVGDVCLFEDDSKKIREYKKQFNLKIVKLSTNYIFKNGFSDTLNILASTATNDMVIYLNVGEIIEVGDNIINKISPDYNAYYIDHGQEKHRWWRCYNRHELKWSGLIHEELIGEYRPFHKPLFRFADTEKDNDDAFKSKCYDDVKELCYFNQLCRLVDDNSLLGATSGGWIQFASDQYQSMQERLNAKGGRWEAFKKGDMRMYLEDILSNPEFEKQRFESSLLIEYQNGKRHL